jgi:UDP-2,3-diacylglucosamine pyrophosphatase LpxH
MPTRYRTIFLSDLHLGFRGCRSKQLHAFLKSVECDLLILDGDIFDLWVMKKGIHWDHSCTAVLRRILKMVKNGTHVIYIPGNHDDAIRTYLPFDLGEEIDFMQDYVHVTAKGERLHVTHGDGYDFVIAHMKWLARVGTILYGWLLRMNGGFNAIREIFGMPYFSLAGYLKKKAKGAVSFIADFEDAVETHAKALGCTGAIVGHIHTPKLLRRADGFLYGNCGDWVESLTALVEEEDGELQLIHWTTLAGNA